MMSSVFSTVMLDLLSQLNDFNVGYGLWLILSGLVLLVFWGRTSMHRAGYFVLILGWIATRLGQKLLPPDQMNYESSIFVLAGIGIFVWALGTPFLMFLERWAGKQLLDVNRWVDVAPRWLLNFYFLYELSLGLAVGVMKLFKLAPGQLSNARVFSLIVLLTGFLVSGVLTKRWYSFLALIFFAVSLVLSGLSLLPGMPGMCLLKTPVLMLTAMAAAMLVVLYLREDVEVDEEAETPWLAWYQSISGRVMTHVLLICFTMLTLYPVLLVFKKAVIPTQGFDLELSPVPSTLRMYYGAWKYKMPKVQACYGRAMRQNFNEVMGTGSACLDIFCQKYRTSKNKRWLSDQKVCHGFHKAVLLKKEGARKKAIAAWQASVLAKIPSGSYKVGMTKVLQEVGLQHLDRKKRKGLFFKQLGNSVFVAFITTILGIFLACTAAYAFSRFDFVGRQTGLMSFLVSQMFPGTLMMIPLYILISRMGLLNSLVGLTLVYSTTSIPFCVWTLKGYFDTIPKEIEEAAIIDGATKTMIFIRIILPLSKPAIAVTALFSFMTAWNEFILAATFMNQESSYTLPVLLQSYVGAHTTEWGHFAAGAILVSLPIVALFYVLQKYLVSGLTAGSVKG